MWQPFNFDTYIWRTYFFAYPLPLFYILQLHKQPHSAVWGEGVQGMTHIHLWIMPFPKTRALSKPICKEKFPWNCFVERLKLCPPPPPTTLRNRKGQAHSLFEILAFSVVDTRDYLVMWMVKQILYHQSELSLNVNTIISSILIGDPKFANTIHVSEFDKGWDK